MSFDPQKHHRRSIRLQGYDYSQAGAYYFTIVTQGKAILFGDIENGEMILNEAGKMILKWWHELPKKFPNIKLGTFIIMPNHVHGIIIIESAGVDLRVNPAEIDTANGRTHGSAPTLGTIIQWFKTMTTNEYIRGIKNLGWRPFDRRLWQRNYYEHIIRNQQDWERIHDYILANPANRDDDKENPAWDQLHPNEQV